MGWEQAQLRDNEETRFAFRGKVSFLNHSVAQYTTA